jgi:hypothetical protein
MEERMDARHFDRFTRALTEAGTRRGLLALLATLPVLGGLFSRLDPDDLDAKGRRKRRKKRHKHGKGRGKGKHKKPKCKPHPKTTTCSGQCGSVKNNCKKSVDCGPCECDPPCGACQTCSDALVCETCATCCDGVCCTDPDAICHLTNDTCCVPDAPAQTCNGQCGEILNNCGQPVSCPDCTCDPACEFCQRCNEASDTCEADPAKVGVSCGECQQCAADGNCDPCANQCCDTRCCADPAAICHLTDDSCCVPESVAETCGSQTCGMAINNCGQAVACTGCTGCCNGETCVAVADQSNQLCGTGVECASCLESNGLCRSGTCQACDVCPSGECDFTSVQAAINASSPQLSTILICPGTYVENGHSLTAVAIARSLSLIGAGEGEDDTTNTILRPELANRNVVRVLAGSARPAVALEGLRVTGGSQANGRGINAIDCTLTVTDCAITQNHTAAVAGSGMALLLVDATLTNTHITFNSTPSTGGGMDVTGGKVTLDAASRVTNNQAGNFLDSGGGIFVKNSATVELPSVANVTDNEPDDCRGPGGTYTGPGSICTST